METARLLCVLYIPLREGPWMRIDAIRKEGRLPEELGKKARQAALHAHAPGTQKQYAAAWK